VNTLRTLRSLSAVLLVLAVAATTALADGVMIPRPIPGILPAPEPFTIRYHRVDVTIENQAATTEIDQVFVNNNDHDIEGTYIFPIPETASITEFAMWMNGEKVTGELLGAEEARRIYADIVRQMKDPGLLEYAGRDMYRARVYPIPAKGEIRVEMSYQELLELDAGLVTYRYPLDTERFSAEPLEDVSITVKIESAVPVKSLMSPSHEIDSVVSGLTASCGYEDADVLPDRDFYLYYTVAETDLGLNLVTHKAARDDGYFMLLLSPGLLEDPGKVIAKDIVFVFDRSGSMSGRKIKQAKAALRFALTNLNEEDRFNVITFATQGHSFADELVPATSDNILDVIPFVEGIEAGGSTDIDSALEEALDLPDSDRPKMIVFLTDGLPTTGVTDVTTILDNVEGRNGTDARIFVFGVGYDVNTTLLDRLSLDNRGTVDYVKAGEDIEQKVTSFYSKIAKPILSDIAIDFGDVRGYDTYPITLPDVFNGTQTIVFGRYEGSGETDVRLTGHVGDRREELVYGTSFPGRESGHDFIPPLWASRKIAYLTTEMRLHGEDPELKDEVVRLATEFGIVTPYTSYLIREDLPEGQMTSVDGERVRVITNVGEAIASPHYVIFGGSGEAEVKKEGNDDHWGSIKAAYGAPVSQDAVALSSRLSRDRGKAITEGAESGLVRRIGTRVFFYHTAHKGWVDSEYTEDMDVSEVEYLGEEYFSLLDRSPEIGKYLSLGERVVFLFGGKAYRVSPSQG